MGDQSDSRFRAVKAIEVLQKVESCDDDELVFGLLQVAREHVGQAISRARAAINATAGSGDEMPGQVKLFERDHSGRFADNGSGEPPPELARVDNGVERGEFERRYQNAVGRNLDD